jgi:AcrR family transcriptional regulator
MPRQPDPDLEERILSAAHALWKRGGEKSLTMRAVARAARTNTPAVYRRFKDRRDLVRGLLLRIAARIRKDFEGGTTLEEMAEAYVDSALRQPHEYELFYSHARELSPPRGKGKPRPIRESRPNFAYVETLLAKRLGGAPEDYTQLAARNDDAAAREIDPRRARRGVTRGVPGRGKGTARTGRQVLGNKQQETRRNSFQAFHDVSPARRCRSHLRP